MLSEAKLPAVGQQSHLIDRLQRAEARGQRGEQRRLIDRAEVTLLSRVHDDRLAGRHVDAGFAVDDNALFTAFGADRRPIENNPVGPGGPVGPVISEPDPQTAQQRGQPGGRVPATGALPSCDRNSATRCREDGPKIR